MAFACVTAPINLLLKARSSESRHHIHWSRYKEGRVVVCVMTVALSVTALHFIIARGAFWNARIGRSWSMPTMIANALAKSIPIVLPLLSDFNGLAQFKGSLAGGKARKNAPLASSEVSGTGEIDAYLMEQRLNLLST